MNKNKILLPVIVGPTAVGKTEIAIEVAQYIKGEIVSADSMQIYKYMDIGTAKPTEQEKKGVPHHLIDIIEPDEDFSVADYKALADKTIKEITDRNNLPILSGGTGLYINAVCYNYHFSDFHRDEKLRIELEEKANIWGNEYLYDLLKEVDPKSAEKIHINNKKRLIRALEVYYGTGKPFSSYEEETKKEESPYDLLIFGLTRPREELYERINKRVLKMIEQGLVDEVKKLLSMGYKKELNSMQGLGYKQIIEYLEGNISLNDAIYIIQRDTRHYAKRQYTWFNKNKDIIWLNISSTGKEKIIKLIVSIVEGKLKNY